MRTSTLLFLIGTVGLLIMSGFMIAATYQYNRDYKSLWELADRSSTIEQKSEYIDKFVEKLESSGFEGQNDAIFLKTPENSFDSNLDALKSLQQRLVEIKDIDPSSFEYQTAIQQITQQEQGEAEDMMCTFKGIFMKDNYILLWNWIGGSILLILVMCIVSGGVIKNEEW